MNLLIIQARMGSSRLPGKVLKTINNKTILENVVERVMPAQKVDQIVIATSTKKEDDVIEALCKEKGWDSHRGSDWDVLARFYETANKFKSVKNIIRLTSDCPLHSHKVVDFVVSEFEKSRKDYFSNSNNEPDFLEDGFDVEVFTFDSLGTAYNDAKLYSEREHVTPYIKNSGRFTCGWKKSNKDYQFKLSVDSLNDFVAVKRIFTELEYKKDFGIDEVVDLIKQKPELLEVNGDSVINAGYQKTLDNDKIIE